MLHEHNLGRDFVKGLEQAVKTKNKKLICENARGYYLLIQEHIMKENDILFPMAEEALDPKTQINIKKKFDSVNKKKNKEILKFEKLAREFSKRK